jgi:signal transduction histidine kinase
LTQCACVYDASGRCLIANRSLARWLGRAETDLVGRSLQDLWPASFAAREAADLRLVLQTGRLEQLESRPGHAGMRQVRAVKYPWGIGDAPEVMVVVFEETGPASSLEQPEQLGWLALGIVHDFNNTLTMIRGEVDLLAMGLSDGHGRLTDLERLLEHACQLPRQLLSFARKDPAARQPLDLHTLLRSLDGLLRSRMSGRVELEFRLDPVGVWVEGDPVQLTQAFLNLACNAVDAMKQGGRLVIETVREGQVVRVHFQDTGPGIAPEALVRIFEPLYTMRQGGNGLGLAVVREVVRRHGGQISCVSQPGQGARFILELPVAGSGRRQRTWSEEASGTAGTALIIDPDLDITRLSALVLEQAGFRVHTRYSLPRLQDVPGRVDLVIVDASLLNGEGARTLEQWLRQQPGAGLLVTSAGSMPVMSPLCQERLRGMVGKPYSPEVLLRAVRRSSGER